MLYSCDSSKTPESYKLSGGTFPMPNKDGKYLWHVANFPGEANKFEVLLAIQQVIEKWQRAIDLVRPIGSVVSFESTKDLKSADFVISFGKGEHALPGTNRNCGFNFDNSGGVLAHAWSLAIKKPLGGQIHLDLAEDWVNLNKENSADLFTVFMHEFGHALGISHSTDTKALMHAFYTGPKKEFTHDDLEALQERFGPIKRKLIGIPERVLPNLPLPLPPTVSDGCFIILAVLLLSFCMLISVFVMS